jgi:pimeloyl-ACP methyl ester carboxylesterase
MDIVARRMRRNVCLLLAMLPALGCSAAAQTPTAPTMVQLSTGSRVATWRFAAESASRTHQTPVIFLHGGPGMFTEIEAIEKGAVLRAAGFSTIYFDQAGAGQSDRTTATQYTLQRAVDDVEALRLSLKVDKIILWGNSYGAELAVLYERRFPDRVAAMIFSSPGGFPGAAPRLDYSRTDQREVPVGKPLADAARLIDRRGGGAEAELPQDVAGQLLDAQLNAQLLDGRMVCKGSTLAPQGGASGSNLYPNRMLAKELKAMRGPAGRSPTRPVIIIRGACDFMPMANAAKYQALYGGNVVTIDKTGHGLRENSADLEVALRQFATVDLAGID